MTAPRSWDVIRQTPHADCKVYQVTRDTCRHPDDGRIGDFFVMHCPNWVLVLALTPDNQLVMVRQYRFGNRLLSWEIPGGVMDKDESPLDTAVRELREETGFVGRDPVLLGSCSPNPALQNNRSHVVLIRDCERHAAQDWDEHEELEVTLMDRTTVTAHILDGRIHHALALNALYFLELYERGMLQPPVSPQG